VALLTLASVLIGFFTGANYNPRLGFSIEMFFWCGGIAGGVSLIALGCGAPIVVSAGLFVSGFFVGMAAGLNGMRRDEG
jgi:hypothetical protein